MPAMAIRGIVVWAPAPTPKQQLNKNNSSLLLYLPQPLFIKSFHCSRIKLVKVSALFQVLLDDNADMIEQVILKALRLNAIGTKIMENKVYLLVADRVH